MRELDDCSNITIYYQNVDLPIPVYPNIYLDDYIIDIYNLNYIDTDQYDQNHDHDQDQLDYFEIISRNYYDSL